MQNSTCPLDPALQRFNAGLINSDEELDEIASHLGTCEPCRKRLIALAPSELQSQLFCPSNESEPGPSLQNPVELDANVNSILDSVAPPTQHLDGDDQPFYEMIGFVSGDDLFHTYLANDVFLQQQVLLKIVRKHQLNSIDAHSLFRNDVQNLAKLSHPNILPLTRFGRWGAQQHYLVLPAVNHLALDRWIDQGNPFDLPALLTIFGQVCEALEYAHSQQVVHRHLEPNNIFLDLDGHVMASEFGLFLDGRYQDNLIEPLATPPRFAAPETTQNVPAYIDVRTDIYSAGKLLTYLLDNSEIDADDHLALENIAEKCTRYSRKTRFQTVPELTAAIFKALAKS